MLVPGLLAIMQLAPLSPSKNPLPATVIVSPARPVLGVSEIDGPSTVNETCAKSPSLPVTVIV
jgi:hypothetical protein